MERLTYQEKNKEKREEKGSKKGKWRLVGQKHERETQGDAVKELRREK